MIDIHISGTRLKKEFYHMVLCLVIAFIINIIAIILYKTDFSEVYTQWMWQLLIAGGLYALSLALRMPFYLLFALFKPRKKAEVETK